MVPLGCTHTAKTWHKHLRVENAPPGKLTWLCGEVPKADLLDNRPVLKVLCQCASRVVQDWAALQVQFRKHRCRCRPGMCYGSEFSVCLASQCDVIPLLPNCCRPRTRYAGLLPAVIEQPQSAACPAPEVDGQEGMEIEVPSQMAQSSQGPKFRETQRLPPIIGSGCSGKIAKAADKWCSSSGQ